MNYVFMVTTHKWKGSAGGITVRDLFSLIRRWRVQMVYVLCIWGTHL